MVKFKPNIVVSDVYGSAGDMTAHHRDGKTFLRKRSDGGVGRPRSVAQVQRLDVHRRALAAWREQVADDEKERWNAYAREVEPHRPPFDHSSWISGQNLFVSAYHGFYTLGREQLPVARRFEKFPAFALRVLSGRVEGADLVMRVEVSGLELLDVSRYWLYGQVQLMPVGRGQGNSPRKSVLSDGPCTGECVSLRLRDWQTVWPDVAGALSVQLYGRFLLLDEVTGFRGQRQGFSGWVKVEQQ